MKDYKEILEGVVNIINTTEKCDTGFVNICSYIGENCPELKESEDERIRKALIKGFNECLISSSHYPENAVKYWHGIVIDAILAWLEKQGESDETKAKVFLINKGYPIDANGVFPTYEEMYNIIREGLEQQGEQKPADKVEPKFEVGDCLCDGTLRKLLRVDEVLSDMYRLTDNTGKIYYKPKVDVEAVCRKFDVLKDAEKKEPKKIEQTTWKPSDEQIGALEHFVRSIAESGFASPYDSNTKLVYSLLNDLKKLKL